MGGGVVITPQLLYPQGREPVPIVQKAGWAPGLVWMSAENLALTGVQTVISSAVKMSLY